MSYLDAAKRAITLEQEIYQQEEATRQKLLDLQKLKTKEKLQLKQSQDNIDFEKGNPELVKRFEKFADNKGFLVVRNEDGELYVDDGRMVVSFKFWAEMGDRLKFI